MACWLYPKKLAEKMLQFVSFCGVCSGRVCLCLHYGAGGARFRSSLEVSTSPSELQNLIFHPFKHTNQICSFGFISLLEVVTVPDQSFTMQAFWKPGDLLFE